jgi:hypothetical protein
MLDIIIYRDRIYVKEFVCEVVVLRFMTLVIPCRRDMRGRESHTPQIDRTHLENLSGICVVAPIHFEDIQSWSKVDFVSGRFAVLQIVANFDYL